jgi:2-succinyl-6-hydroxy-2,4-cyclohexadiene-1-carboxylate synthase
MGFEGYVDGRAAATAIGRHADLPAAKAAGRAIQAQNPGGVARFGRRVVGPARGVIDDLASIALPALVLVGEQDTAYARAGEVMTAKLPNATHVVIPAAGHVANIEQVEAFNRVVIEFLERLPRE